MYPTFFRVSDLRWYFLFEALPIHRAELGVGELGPVLEIESLPLGTRLGDEQAPFEERERPVSLQLVPFEHRRQDRIGDDVLFAESQLVRVPPGQRLRTAPRIEGGRIESSGWSM